MIHSIFEPTNNRLVVALGFFDSVHLGHRVLIDECVSLAVKLNANPAVITFSNNPFEALDRETKLIYTFKERLLLFKALGVNNVITTDFNEQFRNIKANEFLDILTKWNIAAIICGADYKFGHDNQGNVSLLTEYTMQKNILVKPVSDVCLKGQRVSSSEIRRLLEFGEIMKANVLLGSAYFISSTVVNGRKVGRKIGLPTANLLPDEEKLIPKCGVYSAKTVIDGKSYRSVLHIGDKPTFNEAAITCESHLLGFEGDIYGKEVAIYPHNYIRENKKFKDEAELRHQIELDISCLDGII